MELVSASEKWQLTVHASPVPAANTSTPQPRRVLTASKTAPDALVHQLAISVTKRTPCSLMALAPVWAK